MWLIILIFLTSCVSADQIKKISDSEISIPRSDVTVSLDELYVKAKKIQSSIDYAQSQLDEVNTLISQAKALGVIKHKIDDIQPTKIDN